MSLYPNTSNDSNNPNKVENNILFPARVKDIYLNSDNKNFNNNWVELGNIIFKPLFSNIDNGSLNSLLIAKPLFSNIKQYPLKEELVLILNAPSYNLNENSNSSIYYYLPIPISVWNNINHNIIPDNKINFIGDFQENENIKTLLPEEGDIIIEGRFGNSIRFSSTTINKSINRNSWSSDGINGDPIIIISNNHNKKITEIPWIPNQEDINNDGSSIYLCSSQEIPLNFACKNLQSLNITISNAFNPSLNTF
jgi:hypothetical protein